MKNLMNPFHISYAIPVCNEHIELEKLLLFLKTRKTWYIDEE